MLEVATIYLDPLSQTHVYKLEVASLRNEAVFRLNISVDYTQVVKKVQGFHHTSNIKLGRPLWQVCVVSKQCPELPSQADLQQHVQVLLVLECAVQLDNELTVQGCMDSFLWKWNTEKRDFRFLSFASYQPCCAFCAHHLSGLSWELCSGQN